MISRQIMSMWVHATGALLLTLTSASCTGSAKPAAVITMKQGMPCFSVADSSVTKGGIPLYAITVYEMNTPEGLINSKRWSIDVRSADGFNKISPDTCMRYGDVPPGAVERVQTTALKPYTAYHALVDAQPDDPSSNVIAYSASFCLKPDESGQMTIQSISEKKSLGDARFDICKARG